MSTIQGRLTVRRRPKDGVDGASYTQNLVLKSALPYSCSGRGWKAYDLSEPIEVANSGQTYTVSFDYEYKDAITQVGSDASLPNRRMGTELVLAKAEGGSAYIGVWFVLPVSTTPISGKGRHWGIITLPQLADSANLQSARIYIQLAGGTGVVSNFKIEKGDNPKPVWTPAPTDADAISVNMESESFILERADGVTRGGNYDLGLTVRRGSEKQPWSLNSGGITYRWYNGTNWLTTAPPGLSFSITNGGTVNAAITISFYGVCTATNGTAEISITACGEKFTKRVSWRVIEKPKDGADGNDAINLIENSGFAEGLNKWEVAGDTAPLSIQLFDINSQKANAIVFNTSNYTGNSTIVTQTLHNVPAGKYTLSYYKVLLRDWVGDVGGISLVAKNASGVPLGTEFVEQDDCLIIGDWYRFNHLITIPNNAASVEVSFVTDDNTGVGFAMPQFEKAETVSQWKPNPKDTSYLARALQGETTTNGGLFLTSHIKVGENLGAGFIPRAGMNGVIAPEKNNKDIMLWSGGDNVDMESSPTSPNAATSAIRMDGTAYWAKNKIRFTENSCEIGDFVELSEHGLTLFDDKEHTNIRFQILNQNISEILNSVLSATTVVTEVKTLAVQAHRIAQGFGSMGREIVTLVKRYGDKTGATFHSLGSENVGAGTIISGTITVSPTHGGRFVHDIEIDNTVVASFYSSGTTSINYTCNTSGVGRIVTRFVEPANSLGASPNCSVQVTVTPNITVKRNSTGITRIGRDGMCAKWGENTFVISNNAVKIMSGQGQMEFASNTVKILDAKNRWVDLRAVATDYKDKNPDVLIGGIGDVTPL